MMKLLYEEPLPIELSDAKSQMASEEPALIADALLRASLSEVDASWIEAASLQALERPELEVRWAATLALGHLVRRYGHLDLDAVLSKIKPLGEDPKLWGRIDDLLDDIGTFLREADGTQLRKLKKAHTEHKRKLAAIKRMAPS